MSASVIHEQAERDELEAILNSGAFNRSPILASFLRYVCERYFEGGSDGVKEYSIAVEALKRPPDFDQKKDAIVRVEAHRLRKRLADYYRTEGAGHRIHIEIPNGQYAPRFLDKGPVEEAAPSQDAAKVTPVLELQNETLSMPVSGGVAEPAPVKRKFPVWAICAGLAVAVVLAVLLVWTKTKEIHHPAPAPANREVWQGSFNAPVASDFRMLAGYHGKPFIDRQGRTWQPDAYFNGGVSVSFANNRGFQALPDPGFALAQRAGDFEYSIPEKPGTYELHLYFIETQASEMDGAGARMINVFVNDKLALDHVDTLSDAGAARRLTSRVLSDIVPGKDGRIRLRFQQQGSTPELTALEILASTPGSVLPVRIVAAAHSVRDSEGQLWLADQYVVGGNLLARKNIVKDDALKALYSGERYGNFSYHIPLPPGKYRVKLYFAESYFDSRIPLSGAREEVGARVFNVFAEGVTLLRNFDIVKEAGGAHRPIVRTFENLEPNAQGKILLQFVPVRNYAEVNAIEVTQMKPIAHP
jgi:hypothetical protein